LCSRTSAGTDYRYVGYAFRRAVKTAEIDPHGKLTLHSLRHGFASLLIAEGLNVVFVSRPRRNRERGARN
jgi:integrase